MHAMQVLARTTSLAGNLIMLDVRIPSQWQ